MIVHEHTFDPDRIIQRNRDRLRTAGYTDSVKQKGLFFKPLSKGGVLFVDTRCWEMPDIIYVWAMLNLEPAWLRHRTEKEITKRAMRNLIVVNGFHKYNVFMYHKLENKEDGFCRLCGKSFDDDGLYCSPLCEKAAMYESVIDGYLQRIHPQEITTCAVCGEGGNLFDNIKIEHHVSYYPEIIMYMCAKCHQKIHKTDMYPHLKPLDGDSKDFYNGVKRSDNQIISGIIGDEVKVFYSARASYYPKNYYAYHHTQAYLYSGRTIEKDIEYYIMYHRGEG